MTASSNKATGWNRIGTQSAIPPGDDRNLQANTTATAPAGGQAVYYDASGNVALNDGTAPGLVCAGVCDDKEAPVSSIAAANSIRLWQGFFSLPLNGTGSDAILSTTTIAPIFDVGNGVPGLRSNDGTSDRSFMGLTLGLGDDGNPIVFASPIAQILARALHSAQNSTAGSYGYAVDVSASTDQGSLTGGTALLTIGFLLPRPKRRELVTSVEILPVSTQAHALTNYRVIQLWKFDTTGVVPLASSPLVATFSTLTQDLTAGQPTVWTLGAASALLLRETDVLVGTSIHTAGGVALPLSAIRAISKVI